MLLSSNFQERLRRLEEEGPAEVHDNKDAVLKLEEAERERRMKEDAVFTKDNFSKLIHTYQFQEEILALNKDGK